MRAGIGYDIHRLKKGRKLVLGGVTIPYEKGLVGHSDADVAIHAIIDAMFGAAAIRDIGYHFPPGDPKYKDISSAELLRSAIKILSQQRFSVENIDVTVVTEEPALSPYIEAMRINLSNICGLTSDRIMIKAKTNECLGDIGRKKAIAALAVVLLKEV